MLAGLATPGAFAAESDGLATATQGFDAEFAVNKAGLPLGTTHFSLASDKRQDGNPCFVYRGQANPNALVHMFLGDIDESSHFCVVDGQIRPMLFSHSESGKPKKSYTLTFDWQDGQAHYQDHAGRTRQFTIQPGVQDPLSIQIAARAAVAAAAGDVPSRLAFRLADDDGVEDFILATSSGGTIDTQAGHFQTLRVARAGDHSHTLVLWLARDARWIPVQVETGSHGTTFTMQAQSLTLAD